MTKKLREIRVIRGCFLILLLFASGLAAQEPRLLEPGQPVEREIAGGETHVYQIALTVGQFLRLVVDQRDINIALALALPEGETRAVDLTGVRRLESLSQEITTSGDYRLKVSATGQSIVKGTYRVRMEVRASPTAEDKQRITAERLLLEASTLANPPTFQQCIEKSEQALKLWRELGDRYWESTTLNLIGFAHQFGNRYQTSIEYYEHALQIAREIKDRMVEALALRGIASSSSRISQYDRAIECLEQSLAIDREEKYRAGERTALIDLSAILNNRGSYEKAIEIAEQALQIAREMQHLPGEGSAFQNLAMSYGLMSRLVKSIEYSEQALMIFRSLKNRNGERIALNNLGLNYTYTGRFEKALEYFEQALTISRELKDRRGEASNLTNMGIAYEHLGRGEKAIEYATRALAIWREVKDPANEAATLGNLGVVAGAHGQYDKAIEYDEQALAISRKVKDRAVEGRTLNSLGVFYQRTGRLEHAIPYIEQALSIFREAKLRGEEGVALANLAAVHRLLGRYEKAAEYIEQGVRIVRETKRPRSELIALSTFARIERDRGNLARARSLIEEALQIAESQRSAIHNQESRASYFASVQDSNELNIDLLMRLHKQDPSGGFDALALESSERARARGLLELLTEAGTDIRQGVDASLLERERALATLLNTKAAAQVQLLGGPHTPEQAGVLKQEIGQLETDYEQTRAHIRRASPRYAALTQPEPLKLSEIQRQVLDRDTLLLEYALGEERSYLWAITSDSLSSYELPKREEIQNAARHVTDLLTARSGHSKSETAQQRERRVAGTDAQLPEAARQLSRIVLGPVASQLGGKRLLVVPDGALQYVPFAMLPKPGIAVATPLVMEHEVISLPSASTLAVMRKELAARRPAENAVAIVADPVFSSGDDRIKGVAGNGGEGIQNTEGSRILEHLAEKSDDGNAKISRIIIPRLPFTRQEADQILAVATATKNLSAVDFKASKATVTGPELGKYRYVHFATHGYLDSERPAFSALVLSMVDAEGKPQDGFLRANEVYNLNLPAELVVLSACQTGLGREIKGEGLVGLTRGFMYAGAARVVVSLWSVSDKATSELMTKFYKKMLKGGQRPAAALRAAQVEMWKQKQWQAPYYWAAFVLQGEWK